MAVWEGRQQVTAAKWGNIISQISWTDGVSQDTYYWLENSFQYAANINTDDELHGIKLSNRADFTSNYAKCQLVSLWERWVMALPVDTTTVYSEVLLKRFQYNWYYASTKWEELNGSSGTTYSYSYDAVPWVVFMDKFWFGYNTSWWSTQNPQKWYISSIFFKWTSPVQWDEQIDFLPYDHNDYTDESISDAWDVNLWVYMQWNITAILNYNNTRLVVAAGQDIWVYYPELDDWSEIDNKRWATWWKRVLTYEAWVTIVALTCTFEYLKVWAVDEWWNTKVYYYQGNNNLRSTFVYNIVDLTWVRVLHVYSVNGVDYYTSSIDWSDWLIDLNKMVWATPVKLFTQRAGLTVYDINTKAPYFVWPTSISWDYNNWWIYIADAYGVFKFRYNPQWYDKWYLKWRLYNNKQVYWLCVNKGFLYVSTENGCYAMRLYDTWVDWYQESWVLISREFEWREGWAVTKMLDEIRMNFELNPNTNKNGTIDVYVSPNNLWKSTSDFTEANKWYHAMHITQDSAWTRAEKSNLFNDLWWSGNNKESSFKFDWQTITYAIVITRWTEQQATPIVRQITLKYHCKDKVNNVYDIN